MKKLFGLLVLAVTSFSWAQVHYHYSRPVATPTYAYRSYTIPGMVDVQSNPAGAHVYIDGRYVGQTPLRVATGPGQYTVRLEFPGYSPSQGQVLLNPSQVMTVNANLVQASPAPTYYSAPQTGGATVSYYAGHVQAATNVDYRTIVGSASGGTQVIPIPGGSLSVTHFTPATHSGVAVSSSSSGALFLQVNVGGASVAVNSQYVGTIPSGSGQYTLTSLPPGQHRVTVSAAGFSPVEQVFVVRAGFTTRVDAVLLPF